MTKLTCIHDYVGRNGKEYKVGQQVTHQEAIEASGLRCSIFHDIRFYLFVTIVLFGILFLSKLFGA